MIFTQSASGMHYKCRNDFYPGSNNTVHRVLVLDSRVSWASQLDDYKPQYCTLDQVIGKPWAEPEIGQDGFQATLKTCSFHDCSSHRYEIIDGYPINPAGRTGLRGRGLLGKWGPNDAADPIVTRWKKDSLGRPVWDQHGKPYLEFVAIKRRDTGEWALPGGFVDPGEQVGDTLKREFMEEAMNSLDMPLEKKKEIQSRIDTFFSNGIHIYHGYVDDPRNTDNAWMSTTAVLFHDESGSTVGEIDLAPGDDAGVVMWKDVGDHLFMYANHQDLLKEVANRLNSHFNI